jgi:MFS family permease
MLTALGRTVPALQACRALLGLAEAANWPAAMVLVQRMFPPADRAFANGLFTSGSGIGAMITPPIVVALMGLGGWRLPFLLLGGIGLVWVVIWLGAFAVTPLRAYNVPAPSPEERRIVDWRAIFGRRLFYALVVISLTNNSYWHFIANWLPTYLVEERKFTFIRMGFAAIIPYLGMDVGNWLGGFMARIVARVGSVEAGRRTAITFGAVCAAMIWAAGVVDPPASCLAILFLGTMGQGMIGANYLAYCQDVSPADTGSVAGLLGSLGALAGGLILPWAGRVADRTHSFASVFAVLSFFPLVVLFALHVLKGPGRDQFEPASPGR